MDSRQDTTDAGSASVIAPGGYKVARPDELETPAMLLFQDAITHNIKSACELAGGGHNLMVHVKTHKSPRVARRQIELGIEGFKCATLMELEMVLEAGALKAILAFPQCQESKVERLCDLALRYQQAWVSTIASSSLHVDVLAQVCTRRKQSLRVMLDIDAGMHRTGIETGSKAMELYRRIAAHEFLEPAGLHLYDGHDAFSDVVQREAAATRHMKALKDFQRSLEAAGMRVPYVVAGCSFSFPYYARAEGMHGSPGTFVYWDWGFRIAMPDRPFRYAALVLTQVIDRYPDLGLITTDLGYKAVSSDLPLEERALLIGREAARLVSQSEEHGVFRDSENLPQIGEYLLAAPGHVCLTTILYPGAHVVDSAGNVVDYYVHTARDRLSPS